MRHHQSSRQLEPVGVRSAPSTVAVVPGPLSVREISAAEPAAMVDYVRPAAAAVADAVAADVAVDVDRLRWPLQQRPQNCRPAAAAAAAARPLLMRPVRWSRSFQPSVGGTFGPRCYYRSLLHESGRKTEKEMGHKTAQLVCFRTLSSPEG